MGTVKSGHYTWTHGYRRKKKKYSQQDAYIARDDLKADYGLEFDVYLCSVCNYYHVGRQRSMGLPKDNQKIYNAFGNMVAAMVRGKTTPPIDNMRRKQ